MLRKFHTGAPVPGPAFDASKLPMFEPAAALWPRIVAARRHRQRTQRWRLAGVAAAAVIGTAAVLSLPRPATVSDSPLATGLRESQTLESEWRSLSAARDATTGGTTRLRMIDASLQSAYDRDAPAAELTELWQRRNAALRQLILGLRDTGADALGGTDASPMQI